MNLNSFSHCYGQLNYHVVLVTKYRKRVLKTDYMRAVLEVVFHDIARRHGFVIHTVRASEDHIHLFVSLKSTQSISWPISWLKQMLKGASARVMFQLFPEIKEELWGGHLWNKGMFIRSIGSVTTEAVEHYIEHSQEKHLAEYQATPFKVW